MSNTSGGKYMMFVSIKRCMAVFLAVTMLACWARGAVLLQTDFEGSRNFPAGWTEEMISGSRSWKIQEGSGDYSLWTGSVNSPANAHGGTNNATLYYHVKGSKTRFITPVFDSSSYLNVSLSFWHTQYPFTGAGGQDTLKILHSTDGGANWSEIAEYTSDIRVWTQRTLSLPAISANSRIAFEGVANYGAGVCLDDIQVTGDFAASIPYVSVTSTNDAASEEGTVSGSWTITRSGNTSGSLTVYFSMGGTATETDDYTLSSANSVTFGGGETSVTVTLTPEDDLVCDEKDETAVLTLTPDASYGVISPYHDTVTIADNDVAALQVLVIGSTADSGDRLGGQSDPFVPTEIATELQNILSGAGLGTVNVEVEERYNSQIATAGMLARQAYCYDLASWFHWPYPAGVETATRWPNLRGQAGNEWDYVILIGDPFTMEYMPGQYAHGVGVIGEEVAKGTAETVLLMPWPAPGSSSSVGHYKEVVYRAGRTGGYKVAPAALAWEADGSQTNASHPSARGAYICAASIYSRIWGQSATNSTYDYDATLADLVNATVTSNVGAPQFSGSKMDFQNAFLMLGDTRRDVHFSEKGTSTEQAYKGAAVAALDRARVSYDHASYCDTYSSNTPQDDGNGIWTTKPMPIAWNHGRRPAADNKGWVVNPDYWQLGFAFTYQAYWGSADNDDYLATTDEELNDYTVSLMHADDIANAADNDHNNTFRGVSARTLWAQIHQAYPSLRPNSDRQHINGHGSTAGGAYMYTLYSGRCPVDPQPNPITSTWWAQKVGYETAWRLATCSSRAPGFKVMPTSATATNVTPTNSQTLSVSFIFAPTSDVTVVVSTDDPYKGKVSPSVLTFTPANYSNAQTVTVLGESGPAGSYEFNAEFVTASADPAYNEVTDSWSFLNTRPEGPIPSDIRILGNGITIISGDSIPDAADDTDFGVTSSSVAHTFTITNLSGSATVNLTDNPKKVVLTDSTGYFSLSQDAGSSSLAPGEATTFEITYSPSAGGVHTASVSVASSDTALPVYSFAIGGIRPSAPTVTAQGGSSIDTISAQLTGLLSAGGSADAWIVWDDHDAGASSTGDWANVISIGAITEGLAFSNLLSGLETNQTYYYRIYVSNGAGVGWSGSAVNFSGEPAAAGGDGGTGVLIIASTDSIQGFQNTVVGGNSTDGSDWPAAENPPKAIDGSTSTKYLNRGAVGSGFYITPGTGTTLLTDVRIYTANDSSGRDPLTVSIEGANGGDLSQGSSWTVIANSVNLGIDSDTTRYVAGPKVSIGGSVSYTSYRIIVQSIRVPGNYMQFSEFELYGIPGGGSPAIANLAPTTITDVGADLNAQLSAEGTNYDVTVYWGSGDGGDSPELWAHSASLGTLGGTGILSRAVSGLTAGTRYFYTFYASNSATNVWAQPTWQFVTRGAYTGVDGYGVPDTWKDTNTLTGEDWNSLADTDGDGFDNRSEFFAGTDPNNNGSLLAIESTVPVTSNSYEVIWQGVAGKTYKLLFAPDMESAVWMTNQSGITGVSPQTTATTTNPGSKGFFKIVLE